MGDACIYYIADCYVWLVVYMCSGVWLVGGIRLPQWPVTHHG